MLHPNIGTMSNTLSLYWEATPELGYVSTKDELHRITHSHTQLILLLSHHTNQVYHACREIKKENAKPVSSTTKIQTSQLASANFVTHITYHTQHKEGPLLFYIVPQAPLPSNVIQGGDRKVQATKPSNISCLHWFINKFQPLISL